MHIWCLHCSLAVYDVMFFFCRFQHVYYQFGLLLLVYLLFIIICIEVTIILCYFHLIAQVSLLISMALSWWANDGPLLVVI